MPESRVEYTHRALITLGLSMLAVLVGTAVVLAADVLLLLFGGVLLAVLLRGLADLLSAHSPVPARASLAIVLLALFAIFGAGTWFLAGEIANQLDQLGSQLMQLWERTEARLRSMTWGRQLLALQGQVQSGNAADTSLLARVTQAFSTTLGLIASFAIVLVTGIYIAANPGWYQRGLVRLVAPSQRPRARELLSECGRTLRLWLFGRVVGMLVVGVMSTVGLWLLDVPFALGLGAIAAMFDFVPNIGPIVAAVPAVLVALGSGPTDAAYVAALYLGIQAVEGYLLTPQIEKRSVNLPPAFTIAAQVLMGVLLGGLGVVLATPLAAVVVVLVKRLYVEDKLEHEPR